MLWFKHVAKAKDDPTMKIFLAEFGYEGYGAYWAILESIAENINGNENPGAKMTYRQWCNSGSISQVKFKKILSFLEENFKISIENSGKFVIIKYPKMLEYRDEYTRRKVQKSG